MISIDELTTRVYSRHGISVIDGIYRQCKFGCGTILWAFDDRYDDWVDHWKYTHPFEYQILKDSESLK